jgi:sec-independent protein translocase protein TatA
MGLDNPLHIAFLVVILLLVFGAKRLPEIGRSLGSGMREFKTSVTGESQPALPPGQQQPQRHQQPAQPPAQVSAQPPAQVSAQPPAQVTAQPPAQAPATDQAAVAEPVATPSAPTERPPGS